VIWPWRRRRREAELEEEIAGHLAMAARDRVARGEGATEAAWAARREFGNGALVKEITRRMWGGAWLDAWLRELRFALRSLRRGRGFVAVAVLSLGLGLGLVTTMFAILDAATHPWVPFRDAGRVWVVHYWVSQRDARFQTSWVVAALRQRTRAFDAILPYGISSMSVSGAAGGPGDDTARTMVARVPPRLFAVLGFQPLRGRVLEASDVGHGAAVVSDAFWKTRFAGRRTLAGASVAVGDRRYDVVGVVPNGGATFSMFNAAVWLPATDPPRLGQEELSYVIVKLKPGITEAGGDSDLAAVGAYLTRTYGMGQAPFAFHLWPLRNDPMRLGTIHYAMLGAAIAVLLIACANLANLMLARGLARRREVALRLAIGASRAAVVRQMFAEGVILTVAGAALGVALALWGVAILKGTVPRDLWWLGAVRPRLSWRVFLLTFLAAGGAATIFGLIPAARVAGAVSLDEPLKDGAGTTARLRRRYSALVIVEVALTLVLLMGAGLLIKTVHRLASYEFNFPARQLLRGWIMPRTDTPGAPLRIELNAVAAVQHVPGVVDAAVETYHRPLGLAFSAEMDADTTRVLNLERYSIVTPGYLRTMGLPVLRGRDFDAGDLEGDGVVILNSAAAARLYPRGDAVGRMVKLGSPASGARWVRVVGVCRTQLEGRPGAAVAVPYGYVAADPGPTMVLPPQLVVRTTSRDPRIAAAIRASMGGLDLRAPPSVSPYLSDWEAQVHAQALLARLFVLMGAFALVLASVGVYGLLAYTASRRLREFAVRIAVGAARRDVLALVLHDGLVMILAGTGLGAFVAFWAMGLIGTLLEEQQVPRTDVLTLIAVEAVLVAVATAAALGPALRAMRADAIEILRSA
jgi:putative ABC transport system permease protein